MMPLQLRIRLERANRHNIATLRASPLAEISGAFGDAGTLLPIIVALALQGSINLDSTLVFSGLFNVLTGVVFGVPLPVQPMKVNPDLVEDFFFPFLFASFFSSSHFFTLSETLFTSPFGSLAEIIALSEPCVFVCICAYVCVCVCVLNFART